MEFTPIPKSLEDYSCSQCKSGWWCIDYRAEYPHCNMCWASTTNKEAIDFAKLRAEEGLAYILEKELSK